MPDINKEGVACFLIWETWTWLLLSANAFTIRNAWHIEVHDSSATFSCLNFCYSFWNRQFERSWRSTDQWWDTLNHFWMRMHVRESPVFGMSSTTVSFCKRFKRFKRFRAVEQGLTQSGAFSRCWAIKAYGIQPQKRCVAGEDPSDGNQKRVSMQGSWFCSDCKLNQQSGRWQTDAQALVKEYALGNSNPWQLQQRHFENYSMPRSISTDKIIE